MKKQSLLILYSLPAPFFPDGSPDIIGEESVLSRLKAVEEALSSLNYSVQSLEMEGDLPSLLDQIISCQADLIFNLCEEYIGRTKWEMNIAALLEILDIPFTGSSALVLGLSQDKGKTKALLSHAGIPTPAYRVWQPGREESFAGLEFPLIVKPLREDASLGIDNKAYVRDESALRHRVQKIWRDYGQPAIVEEYIDGRELNISILGNEDLQVLPISEIDFSTLPPGLPKICGYAAKWMEGSQEFAHTIPCCPASLIPEIEKKVTETALEAYRVMECRDYARVDIRLSLEGVPFVLEINANPDISLDAGMSRSAKAAGLTYAEFIGRIVEIAQARHHSRLRRSRRSVPKEAGTG